MQRSDTDAAEEGVHDTDTATVKEQDMVPLPFGQPPTADESEQ